MEQKEKDNIKEGKPLTDEEVENAVGGMKVATNGEKSWWRTILDFFFKIKD